jgi:hypothetical protein
MCWLFELFWGYIMRSMMSGLRLQVNKTLSIATVTCLLGIAGVLISSPVFAVEIISTTNCAGVTNPNLNCTSNDIKINDVSQLGENEGGSGAQAPIADCEVGSTGFVDIKLTTQLNATQRYDVLTWFGRDGNDPRSADINGCYVSSLPDSPDSAFIIPAVTDTDACLDVTSSETPVEQYYLQVPFTCQDLKSLDVDGNVVDAPDGEADIFALITWFQNVGTLDCGTGAGQSMLPGSNPKCDISLLTGLDITIVEVPSMTVEKTSTTVSVTAPGTVTYDYLVTNTGNTTLTNISLSDDNDNDDMSCGTDTLLEAQSTTCTATHTVTQPEIEANGSPTPDSGFLSNTVTASSTEADDAMDSLDIPIVVGPAMTVDKSSTTAVVSAPGSVSYSYLVTNTGNVSLSGISLSDDNDEDDMSCTETTLAVGASMTCTASHLVTQAEIDANGSPSAAIGQLSNTVTASSTEAEDATDSLDIPMSFAPSMMLDKSSTTSLVSAAGTVDYDYRITNDGNVTLTGIALVDDNDEDDVSCPETELAPAAFMDCTATHDVTEGELLAFGSPTPGSGSLVNFATASSNESDDAEDFLAIPIEQPEFLTIPSNSTWSLILLGLLLLATGCFFRTGVARQT